MRGSLRSVAVLGIMCVVAVPVTASAAPPLWHAQPSGVNVTLKGIEFTDSCHGWAVGEPGENSPAPGTRTPILATRNGGTTWFRQMSGLVDTTLNRVDFVDNTHGWAIGEPTEHTTGSTTTFTGLGTILRTTNGGRTWTSQTGNVTSPQDATMENDFEGLSFVSRLEGWIAVSLEIPNNSGAILHTADGGATYTSQAIPNATSGVADVKFVNASTGWAVQDNGDIINTTDGGATWAPQFTASDPLEAVAFHDPMRGVAVGDNGTTVVTKDGGVTWNPGVIAAPFGTYNGVTLTDVTFATATLVAVSTEPLSHSKVLISTNGGAVYNQQDSGTASTLNSVAYVRGTNHGWVSGENGTIRSNNPNAGAGC